MANVTVNNSTESIHLVLTSAPLLSGSLRECALSQLNSTEVCSSGGVAAVQALIRFYQPDAAEKNKVLVVPTGDFKSPLTTLSRFYFGVNALIFNNELNWRTWTVPAYTLWPGRLEEFALYDARDLSFPAVLSNVVTSPNEPWHSYVKSIHWDTETNMALLYITKSYLSNTMSQIESAEQLLLVIAKRNAANGCSTYSYTNSGENNGFQVNEQGVIKPSGQAAFADIPFSEWWRTVGEDYLQKNQNATDYQRIPVAEKDTSGNPNQSCFLPVLVFDAKDKSKYQSFLEYFSSSVPLLRPHLIVDPWGHLIDKTADPPQDHVIQQLVPYNETWVVSYKAQNTMYHQVSLDLHEDTDDSQDTASLPRIRNVRLLSQDLLNLPSDASYTPEHMQDLDNIRQYAREAMQTALVRETGIPTQPMMAATAPDGFRYCYTGECPLGNMFTDALREIAQTDVAFAPSFLFNGPGWNTDEIRRLEILENIPYTGSRCGGTMSGLSLLRLLNHSISETSFGGYDGVQQGGKLLQVSGLQVVYNRHLQDQTILSVHVWDKAEQAYRPLNRTQLYTFTSSNHLCFTYSTFPPFMGELLTEAGEIPSETQSDVDFKDDVMEYLHRSFSSKTFIPRLENRLVEDSNRADALELVEKDDCVVGSMYWSHASLSCVLCPAYDQVILSKESAELVGRVYSTDLWFDKVDLVNQESFPIKVTPEVLSLPDYIEFTVKTDTNRTSNDTSHVLYPLEHLHIEITLDPSQLEAAGRYTSSLVLGASSLLSTPGCPAFKMRYGVVAQLNLSSELNQLKGVASFGFTCAAVVVLNSLVFAINVWRHRNKRAVSSMQPVFLIGLSLGVLLMGFSLVPLSIDDGLASQRACDIACMALPWLLIVGFTVSVAALFSKLWRVTIVCNQAFRRVKVVAKDVILPTLILVVLNIGFLLIWTWMDPIVWERNEVSGQPWNTFGTCAMSGGPVGKSMLASSCAVCLAGFLMTCWQALRARNISDEFSESKYLGIAIFGWLQLFLVGAPVLFLVDEDSVVAKYSLFVGLIFAMCMSMLMVVSVPVFFIRPSPTPRHSSVVHIPFVDASAASFVSPSNQNSTSLNLPSAEMSQPMDPQSRMPVLSEIDQLRSSAAEDQTKDETGQST